MGVRHQSLESKPQDLDMSIPSVIGIDFDNTLVSYDEVFYRAALERGLISPNIARRKNSVREYVKHHVSHEAWTELQGNVYGTRMREARSFAGVEEFFETCWKYGREIVVISHKSRCAAAGHPYDLHAAALMWLSETGLLASAGDRSRLNVRFAETREEKVRLIARWKCSAFIDDLPEVLHEPSFPASVQKILFDPHGEFSDFGGGLRATSWQEIKEFFFSHDRICTAC